MPLFLLLFSSMMLAQEYNNVVVTLTDGTSRTISLSEKPIVTIANGKLSTSGTPTIIKFIGFIQDGDHKLVGVEFDYTTKLA